MDKNHMIWDIKYQARESPQITQFNKSSKQVIKTKESQYSTAEFICRCCQLPSLGITSQRTIHCKRIDILEIGEIPQKLNLCEIVRLQTILKVCNLRQIYFTCLTKENELIHSDSSVVNLWFMKKDILRSSHKLYSLI